MSDRSTHSLLGTNDPDPSEIVNEDSDSELLLICEHAGRVIPKSLNGLGLSTEAYDAHISWDIGAADVARGMAKRLGAPLVLQPYSRLVHDCNRPPGALDAMPADNHGFSVPGNQNLTKEDREMRSREVFWPFQDQVDDLFARHPRKLTFAIHSFTPHLNGFERPWDIGLLHRKDTATAPLLKTLLERSEPALNVALNEPYSINEATDWFVPRHAEPRGIGHALIEIRNDRISNTSGIEFWARLLSECVADLMRTKTI